MTFLSLVKELYELVKTISFLLSIMASMTALFPAKLVRIQISLVSILTFKTLLDKH